jgi:hypothetical protein
MTFPLFYICNYSGPDSWKLGLTWIEEENKYVIHTHNPVSSIFLQQIYIVYLLKHLIQEMRRYYYYYYYYWGLG